MKLLQVPTVMLEQRIKQEIEENPALEEGPEESEDLDNNLDATLDEQDRDSETESDDDRYDFDISDYIFDDETPDYKLSAKNKGADDDHKEMPLASGNTFAETLYTQLGLRRLNEKELAIALQIIGNLDYSGYLQRDIESLVDDLAFNSNIKTDVAEIESVLKTIQEFDPPGVGARDLQECLLIQLKRKKPASLPLQNAILILEKGFLDFTRKHYDKIQRRLKLTDDDIRNAINEILKLNPKPGNSLGETTRTNHYIVPDFLVTITGESIDLALNSRNAPELRVNRTYSEMLQTIAEGKNSNDTRQKEALMFVKQKLDGAKWFIDAIKQRQNTLLVTMEAIINYQKEFFLTGDETQLKPMILKDIADTVNLDISTVSRVANSKYVQTPYGTLLLKTFFSESLQTDSGEEVSNREVKKILQDCIEAEDKSKPVTDDELAKILKKKGYGIARRTVTKYREQLEIPVARLRKELT
jgi:RNA polymerase sigma-54 factor